MFYRAASGNEPVREWLKTLDVADRKIVGQDIAIAEFGWPVGMPVCRPLGNGLYEIRSDLASHRIARVIFVRCRAEHGAAAWFHQEDAEDIEVRIGPGADAKEGDGIMTKKKKTGRVGSSFSDYLKDEGSYEETSAVAVKKVLAWQLEQAMRKEGLNKNEMAKRMRTSRSQLDRILDPGNAKIQLDTVFKAAHVLGRGVKLELV